MRKLVLFDIDGTILLTSGAGRRAVRRALLAAMGTDGPIDGVPFDGKTDPQIVRELLQAAAHPDAEAEEAIQRICERYVELLEEELQSARHTVDLLPGIVELLHALERRTDTVVGLLTGNLRRGAELKLRHAGLEPARFRVGAYGSDAVERDDLPPLASERAAGLMGAAPRGEAMVIIGDTPADITCGAGIGARAIGVTTGRFLRQDLESVGAFAVFDDLSETDAVLAAIYA